MPYGITREVFWLTMSAPKTILGGDDVRAIVVDCGSWAVRLGSAGDDSPRAILPSAVGTRAIESASQSEDVHMSEAGTSEKPSPPPPKIIAGDTVLTAPHLLRDVNPVYTLDIETGDATIRSWDAMEAVWKAGLSTLRLETANSAMMIVEPTRMWSESDRAAALQHAFEGLGVPAAYIGRGSAMAAFSAARSTACVLDVGAQGATAVPVIEGYALHKPTKRGVVGGAYLSERLREWAEACLDSRPGYDGKERPPGKRMRGDHARKEHLLRAHHELKRERVISADDEVRKYVVTDISSDKYTEAHREFYRLRVIDDLKASLLQVDAALAVSTDEKGNGQTNSASLKGKSKSQSGGESSMRSEEKDDKDSKDKSKDKNPSSLDDFNNSYILPDGNVLSLEEKEGASIGDYLFTSRPESNMRSLTELVLDCIGASDVDNRRDLFGGVVVVGGTTLTGGSVERLTRELALAIPQAYKLKLHAPVNTIERTCAGWIGGSIVASLGTFHQAWVSKAEYDELGGQGALRKCP